MKYQKLTLLELQDRAKNNELKGFFHVEDEDYFSFKEALSQSYAKEYERSPAHYFAAVAVKPKEPTDTQNAFVEGSAWHCALLEPEKFAERYCELKRFDRRTKEGKEKYKEWLANNENRKPLEPDMIDRISKGVELIKNTPEINQYLKVGVKEICAFAKDPVYGILCKAKIDNFIDQTNTIIDPKTTINASPHSFTKSIMNYGYLVQAAWYSDVVKWATGIEVKKFGFLAIEKKPPFGCKLYFMRPEAIELGRRKMQRYLDLHYDAVQKNSWPSYVNPVEDWDAPSWAYYQEAESESGF